MPGIGTYTKTANVVGGTTNALAPQYNSMMAEMKAAAEGIPMHDVDIVIAYTGGTGNDLPETITATDNSGDTPFIITLVGTITYDGSDRPTQVAWVFDAGEINITMTEAFTYTGDDITTIGRTLS